MTDKVQNLTRIIESDKCGLMLYYWAQLYDQYKESSLHSSTLNPAAIDTLQTNLLNAARGVEASINAWAETHLGHKLTGFFEMLAGWEDEGRVLSHQKPIAEIYGEQNHYSHNAE